MRRHRLQRVRVVAGVVLLIGSVAGLVWGAQDNEDVGSTPTTRPRALQGATVPLERGLAASECAGTPLSAMFEVAERKRQLAVYTRQGNTFSEVIVDGTTGKITKVEALTRGAELTAAIAQGAVMVKAKTSLRTAVEAVLTAHPGFHALRVVPTLQGEQPVAEITLVKEGTVTTVVEPLDEARRERTRVRRRATRAAHHSLHHQPSALPTEQRSVGRRTEEIITCETTTPT